MADTVLLLIILISGFYMAWNIGANDVANAMGTSVGSGALSLRQAVIIASILEFSGAFFFGSHVSKTLQQGIIQEALFTADPITLVHGMLASLLGAGVWLQIASYFGWPVSTTHSIVGAIIGFGSFAGGVEAIHWGRVSYIAVSWILSPIFGGLLGFGIFNFLRKKILYSLHPLQVTQKFAPWFMFGMISLLSLGLIYEGLPNLSIHLNLWEAGAVSIFLGILGFITSRLYLKKYQIFLQTLPKSPIGYSPDVAYQLEKAHRSLLNVKKASAGEMEYHTEQLIEEIEGMQQFIQLNQESDAAKSAYALIEKIFGKLQLISACLMAFAHGANDVANAIGPLAAAATILTTGSISISGHVPSWALALGGIGIVIGLASWGWRVIETIGKKLTELTPTRGFAAEFGAAITILFASRLGLPVSATHTLVGAVLGVGLARGIGALNLNAMRDILVSWFITIPMGAGLSVCFFWIIRTLFGAG